jgi:hypothetical protein
MPGPRSHGLPSPAVCAWIVIAMLAMIVIPAVITLQTVHHPAPPIPVDQNSTPHGYTFSLLLFIIPTVFIAGWFLPSEGLHIPKRAFYWTLAILVPLGFLLDFFFAQWFFDYPNVGATLGWRAPALGRPVPVEEYVFYFNGFLAVLLLYIWLGEFWLAAYNVLDYPGEAKQMRRLLQFHPTSLILAVVLIAAAWYYKKHLALPEDQAGFPGYFTFLVAGAFFPSMSFFPVARRFINWRPQPHALLHAAGQPAVGSNSGCPLQLVELPASPDDGHFYRRLVVPTHRGSLCLDRRDLRHGDHL